SRALRSQPPRGAATLGPQGSVCSLAYFGRVCYAGGRRAQVPRPQEDGLHPAAAEDGAAEGQCAVGRPGHRGLPGRRLGLDRGLLPLTGFHPRAFLPGRVEPRDRLRLHHRGCDPGHQVALIQKLPLVSWPLLTATATAIRTTTSTVAPAWKRARFRR